MFLVGIFQWWYGAGWLRHVRRSYAGVLRTANTFSLSLLLKTLFSPFKQISAANVGGSPPAQFHAFLDKTFSRAVGAFIRTFTILFGTVAISLRLAWSFLSIILWTLLPFVPIIGVILWLSGVSVWK